MPASGRSTSTIMVLPSSSSYSTSCFIETSCFLLDTQYYILSQRLALDRKTSENRQYKADYIRSFLSPRMSLPLIAALNETAKAQKTHQIILLRQTREYG